MPFELSFIKSSSVKRKVTKGLDFLLGHFEEPIWSITMSKGKQILTHNKEEELGIFKQHNLLNYRIKAYPHRQSSNPTFS